MSERPSAASPAAEQHERGGMRGPQRFRAELRNAGAETRARRLAGTLDRLQEGKPLR